MVVFRYPRDPSVNYIKRLVGLPGDRIEVRDDHLFVNGKSIELEDKGDFTDGCYVDMQLSTETLGEHTHQVMSCRSPHRLSARARSARCRGKPDRSCRSAIASRSREISGGWHLLRRIAGRRARPTATTHVIPSVVPAGHYLMIGDNRDNSEDSRVWGLVPDENLVGKATRIWFNFDLQRSSLVNWSRIGEGIE